MQYKGWRLVCEIEESYLITRVFRGIQSIECWFGTLLDLQLFNFDLKYVQNNLQLTSCTIFLYKSNNLAQRWLCVKQGDGVKLIGIMVKHYFTFMHYFAWISHKVLQTNAISCMWWWHVDTNCNGWNKNL